MRVVELFVSIQGEGARIGIPTCFVRLEGCNLDCSWCDTSYARTGGKDMDVAEVVEWALKTHFRRVCITGGEPLLHDEVMQLIELLYNYEFKVEVETNGSVDISPLLKSHVMINMDYK
ncbi:MAG TPA: 7-carboxy-7-deazaguanine synthase QueE, partial [Euryarchaeota archaeon]|nr:7-carboxy-7-deazaguanine synthase QueE [Euryarchaeota archaeon]